MLLNINGRGQINIAGGNAQINAHQTGNSGGRQVNIVGGNASIHVTSGEGSRKKTYTAHKEGKNYIVDGCEAEIEKKYIHKRKSNNRWV